MIINLSNFNETRLLFSSFVKSLNTNVKNILVSISWRVFTFKGFQLKIFKLKKKCYCLCCVDLLCIGKCNPKPTEYKEMYCHNNGPNLFRFHSYFYYFRLIVNRIMMKLYDWTWPFCVYEMDKIKHSKNISIVIILNKCSLIALTQNKTVVRTNSITC